MNRAMWTGMLVLAGAGCGTGPAPSGGEPPSTHIFVVGHGWHAGITIRRADLEEGQWPEAGDFPEADYLEVGWGDAAYYRADDPGLGTTLRAGLWPTPSVLHVAGFTRPPSEAFPRSEIIPLPVTAGDLEALVAYIRAEYARDEAGRVQDAGPVSTGTAGFTGGNGATTSSTTATTGPPGRCGLRAWRSGRRAR